MSRDKPKDKIVSKDPDSENNNPINSQPVMKSPIKGTLFAHSYSSPQAAGELRERNLNIIPTKTSPGKPSNPDDYEKVLDVLGQNSEIMHLILQNKLLLTSVKRLLLEVKPQLNTDMPKGLALDQRIDYFVQDIHEIQENLKKFSDKDINSQLKIRDRHEFLNDVKQTHEYLHDLILYRCFQIINSIQNRALKEASSLRFETISNKDYSSYEPHIDICFSQENASSTFKASQAIYTSSAAIVDKDVQEIGQGIKEGNLDPEFIKVRIFKHQGRWVAENNRGFSAACISGIFPMRLLPTFPEQLILKFYEEKLDNVTKLSTQSAPRYSPKKKEVRDMDLFEAKLHSIELESTSGRKTTVSSMDPWTEHQVVARVRMPR